MADALSSGIGTLAIRLEADDLADLKLLTPYEKLVALTAADVRDGVGGIEASRAAETYGQGFRRLRIGLMRRPVAEVLPGGRCWRI